MLSIPDLSSESPPFRAASICSSGFSHLQHPFARSVLMACRALHARMRISGVERDKKVLLVKWKRDWRERREEGGNMSEEICEEICEKMGEEMGEKSGEDKRGTVIYRVRSPGQNVEDSVNHPEVRCRKRSHA